MTKNERQEISFTSWKENNHNSIIMGGTGYGKTFLAINKVIKYSITTLNAKKIMVIVPTLRLKEDWIERLKDTNLKGIDVIVINTASKLSQEVDLLIVDEIHRIGSLTFVEIFKLIKYNYFLGLTPLLERTDDRHEIILKYTKISDIIPLKECIENGWTEAIEIVKVPIELTTQERNKYTNLNVKFENIKDELGGGNPLDKARKFLRYLNRHKWYIHKKNLSKVRSKVELLKWFFSDKKKQLLINKGYSLNPKGYNTFIELNYEPMTKEHRLFKNALLSRELFKIIAARKDILYNAQNKLSKTLELVERHKDQYKFVIGQKIEFLELIKDNLPKKETGIYHSKLKKKEKENFFKRFIDGRTKMKTLISAKSLIEGINIDKLEIVIVTSFTSSKINNIQLQGRIGRLYKNKKPIVYYLYCKDSIEETSWLKNILN